MKFNFFNKNKEFMLILFFCILIFALAVFRYYKKNQRYNITAKFAQSGPLYKDMPVFYKGNKIGKTTNVSTSEDYKYTFLKIILFPSKKDVKLPDDIVVKVKRLNVKQDYVDLVSQDTGTEILLKSGSTIDGEAGFDLEGFLADIADADLIVPLLQTTSDTMASINKTSDEIKNFVADSRQILKDNRQNIKNTTGSLTQLTSNFNKSFSKEKLENTTASIDKSSENIQMATENIKNITQNVDCATKNLDTTMKKIDCTLSETTTIASNIKHITNGLLCTLCKRFAGIRIIFGKPLNNCSCPKNCCK